MNAEHKNSRDIVTYRWVDWKDVAQALLQEVHVLDFTRAEVVDVASNGICDPLNLSAEVRNALNGLRSMSVYLHTNEEQKRTMLVSFLQ